jgi:hypothetical protein
VANDRLTALEKELNETYHRWDELEKLAAKFSNEADSNTDKR